MDNGTERMWTIREMCDEFEVTPRTLRFWEAEKGLLNPKRLGLKRLYPDSDRIKIPFILKCKRFGLELETIYRLLRREEHLKPSLDLLHIFNVNLQKLRREERELVRRITALEKEIESVEDSLREPAT